MSTNTQENWRHRTAAAAMAVLCCGVGLLAASQPAYALDGYEDRTGVFTGVGVGGGVGAMAVDDRDRSGFEDGNYKLGLYLNGTIGGGLNDWITLGADLNWWIRTVSVGPHDSAEHHASANAAANIFLLPGLYVEAAAGLAYTSFDSRRGDDFFVHREMGLALKGGVGYEFFMTGDLAAGVEVGYTRHFYQNADFDTFVGNVTLRWY